MIHEQGSTGWLAERSGKITASMMNAVMALPEDGVFKTGPRKGQPYPVPRARVDYIHRLAAERITGKLRGQVKAAALDWGKDVEPVARAAYEARRGVLVKECGFITHPLMPFVGASPDFLVDDDGGGEIKCPESIEVHLATLEEGLPQEHINQIQGGLMVTAREWWDFVSFHPDFPPHLRLYIFRVTRNDIYIEQLHHACASLETEVQKIVERHALPLQAAA